MKKLKIQTQISVDGFIAGPQSEMDWLTWNWDDALKQYVQNLTAPVDCILLGRKLAQGFIPHWEGYAANPETSDDFSRKMVDTQKVVFSKTLDSIDGKNTLLNKGNLAHEVNELKKQPGGDIIAYGGANFVSELIKHDLIDEYHLFMNPAAVGSGMPIFTGMKKLNLVKATPFDCGIVVLQYAPNRQA